MLTFLRTCFSLFHDLRAALDAEDPALFWLLSAGSICLIITAFRRYAGATFEKLPRTVQCLPAMLLTSVVAALSAGTDVKRAFLNALVGAFMGLLPIGVHHTMKIWRSAQSAPPSPATGPVPLPQAEADAPPNTADVSPLLAPDRDS